MLCVIYDESFTLSVRNKPFMLNVIMLNVILLSVVMLSIVMLSAVMLSIMSLSFRIQLYSKRLD
jgi:hypothetical protein